MLLQTNPNRFPRPDFESGYHYPEFSWRVPSQLAWDIADCAVLLLLLGFVTWAVYKRRARRPIFWASIVSVGYFGFLRGGCVCSVGAVQNVALAFVDASYKLPLAVLAFFLLPIVFALVFGRVYCSGVCPFGALQDLVNVKNFRLSKAVEGALGFIPWLYLGFALVYALTRTRFIICQFDPFVGIFRLGGDVGMILTGAAFLLLSVFVGRPFCRFVCPYGALLSIFSAVSVRKVEITQKSCINCQLCHHSCPVGAIKAPYRNAAPESPRTGRRRMLLYLLALPVLMAAGALLLRQAAPAMAEAHREVQLHHLVSAFEAAPDGALGPELEAFYSQGRTVEELTASYEAVQADFRRYTTLAGLFFGLVLGVRLVRFSLKRGRKEYEIDPARCVACGKCFNYCPQNRV